MIRFLCLAVGSTSLQFSVSCVVWGVRDVSVGYIVNLYLLLLVSLAGVLAVITVFCNFLTGHGLDVYI